MTVAAPGVAALPRARGAGAAPAALAVVAAGPTAAVADEWPMYALESSGAAGRPVDGLLWGLIILSVGVVVVISALVLIALFKGRRYRAPASASSVPITRSGSGLPWIYAGLALTTAILAGFTVWTISVLAAVDQPPEEPRVTIEVTAQQWWWSARYMRGEDVSTSFITANELHIPVGEPVRLELHSADVIHSFWVPRLAGKMDLIPGQTNVTWLHADEPGVYRGQCAEYCGLQHARMALRVFADLPEDFDDWWAEQLEPAPAPEGQLARAGEQAFILNCGACHTVRGTPAGGRVGPDLTHLMSRSTIAAGILPNTVGHLSGWIANPQEIKPGNHMPNLDLSGPDLDAIRAYLATLD